MKRENCFNGETNLYVEFDCEISKTVNEFPKTVKNMVTYQLSFFNLCSK